MVYTINNEQLTRQILCTIDGSKVTTETGIPLMMRLNLPNVKVSGADVRLAKLDGTPIAREIEWKWDNDDVTLHFPFDTVAGVDSHFYIYYGNPNLTEPAANSTYGSQAVWNGYEAVWHMNVAPTANMLDATGNGHTATPSGLSSGDLVDASYGKAISFASGKYYSVSTIDLNSFSVLSHQIFDNTVQQRKGLMGNTGSGGPLTRITYDADTNSDGWVNLEYSSDINYLFNYTRDTLWNTFHFTKTGTDLNVFQNGVSILSTTVNSAEDLNIILLGRGRDNYFYGDIAELRIAVSEHSTNYASTTHNNLNNPTAIGTDPFYKSIGTPRHQRRTAQFIN